MFRQPVYAIQVLPLHAVSLTVLDGTSGVPTLDDEGLSNRVQHSFGFYNAPWHCV